MSIETILGCAWNANKNALLEYIKTHDQQEYAESYNSLLNLLFDIVIDPHIEFSYGSGKHGSSDIDFIKSFVRDRVYDISYSLVWSYSRDLHRIRNGNYYGIPTEQQSEDYMALCLSLLQNCRAM